MAKLKKASAWSQSYRRGLAKLTRSALGATQNVVKQALKPVVEKRKPPPGSGDWLSGAAVGAAGVRRFRLFRPPDAKFGERLPLLVMLHGCGQDARSFAVSTRMNRLAAQRRFLVLYPEQDRLANAQGCWNWFDTRSGRAHGEAASIMKSIDQVCRLYMADRQRVAVAGLSAGASMAALLATRHPDRFRAVAMHSGIAPGAADSAVFAMSAMRGDREPDPQRADPMSTKTAWPPLLVIQGDEDRVVSARNGVAAAHLWADSADVVASEPRTVQRGNRYGMTLTDFKRKRSTVATLVQVRQLGHCWSGGAANQPFSDPSGPDASRMVWAFAEKHFCSDALPK